MEGDSRRTRSTIRSPRWILESWRRCRPTTWRELVRPCRCVRSFRGATVLAVARMSACAARAPRASPPEGRRPFAVRRRDRRRRDSPPRGGRHRSTPHGTGHSGIGPVVRPVVVPRGQAPGRRIALRARVPGDRGGDRALAPRVGRSRLFARPEPREPPEDDRPAVRLPLDRWRRAEARTRGRLDGVGVARGTAEDPDDHDDSHPRPRVRDARVRERIPDDLGLHLPPARGSPRGASFGTSGLVDRRAVADSPVDRQDRNANPQGDLHGAGSPEKDLPPVVDDERELLEFVERDPGGTAGPEDLLPDGGFLWRQYQPHIRLVLSRQEHAVRLDSPEFGGLKVREERDLAPAQRLLRIILADPRDDLAALVAQIHVHHVQLVRVRVVPHLEDLRDPDVEPFRLARGRLRIEFDLREERLSDPEGLPRGNV